MFRGVSCKTWNLEFGILESWNLGIMESFYLYWRNLKMQFFTFEGCEGVDYLVMLFHKTFVTELLFHILQKEEVTLKITLHHVFSYHHNITE